MSMIQVVSENSDTISQECATTAVKLVPAFRGHMENERNGMVDRHGADWRWRRLGGHLLSVCVGQPIG